jgi:transposase
VRLLRSGKPYFWTEKARLDAIAFAKRGKTPTEIAERMGRSVTAIQRVLHEARKEGIGIPYQKPGRKPDRKAERRRAREAREIDKLNGEFGISMAAIAEGRGISPATARRRRAAGKLSISANKAAPHNA